MTEDVLEEEDLHLPPAISRMFKWTYSEQNCSHILQNHRVPQVGRAHKAHRVQTLAQHRTTQTLRMVPKHSSHPLPSSPFPISVALLYKISCRFMS